MTLGKWVFCQAQPTIAFRKPLTRVSFATSGCALCSRTGVSTGLRGGGYMLISNVLNPVDLSQAGPLGMHFPLLVENLGARCPGRTLRAKSALPKCKHPTPPGGWEKGWSSTTAEGPAPPTWSQGDPMERWPPSGPPTALGQRNKCLCRGFPGGAAVKNLPANAGDTSSIPGLGRSHMPRSNWAREPQLLSLRVWSLCSTTREAATVRGPRTTMKSGPRLPQLEKAPAQKRRPNTAKNKLIN